MLRAIQHTFQAGFVQALICAGLGWLALLLLTNTIGRPVIALRNRVWNRIAGTPIDATAQDILQTIARDTSSQASLRQQLGVVLQEAFLFSDTVMNNLKYASAEGYSSLRQVAA